MEENRLKQLFETEPDFCPSCGAILILPKSGETVGCAVCTFRISIDSLIGRVTSYAVEFTPSGALTASVKKKKMKADESEFGQMDSDRECSKCGNIGMSYTTMQLRSADEGQTIFYICPKCKHREVENS